MQTEQRVTSYEATFNAIDDILWKEPGCGSELDYIEQTSWILFLKYLDDLEREREDEATLRGENYRYIIDGPYRWTEWAAPKTDNGEIDLERAMTGDDLTEFVGNRLFPYLRRFKDIATSPRTLEYKIGEIFGELHNRISSGYNLRDILNKIDLLHFDTAADKHEMSLLYESKIQRMGNAGRNGGEYYTPRPLIRTIVRVVDPKIGETVYDGACGSAGFLCEAFSYMQHKAQTTEDMRTLQDGTFFGKEKKALAYILGTMNMIFHGVSAPDILHTNTLAENLSAVQRRDQYACVLANPPFGGKERAEVQQNFSIRTSETAYLFLQHFIKHLQPGGRAGIVIKNTFLSNTDNASIALRRQLLNDCCLHTVLDLPSGVFTGAGVKTVVLFFEKGRPTDRVWFYQLNLSRNLGKTNPLSDDDLADFVAQQATKADSDNSWTVPVSSLDADTLDLSVKNPNKNDEVVLRSPKEIIAEMQSLNNKTAQLLNEIMEGKR